MWIALTVIASGALLAFFFRGPNAVWGGATLGVVGGLAVALFRSAPFSWMTVGKGVVIGVLLGAGAEILGLLARRTSA